MIDTTALSNGMHTIAWTVTDNLGSTEGIGSRYFRVSNGVVAVDVGTGGCRADGGFASRGSGGIGNVRLPARARSARLESGRALADFAVNTSGRVDRQERRDRAGSSCISVTRRSGRVEGYLRVG